jgi:hypothetical protein
MTNRIPQVVLAACIAIVLPIVVPTAQAKQCSVARPSDQQGQWWSWRLIDGRKCWYEGRTMISKSLLQWSVQSSVKQESRAMPAKLLTEKHNDPLDSRASMPDNVDTFESMWRARALNY